MDAVVSPSLDVWNPASLRRTMGTSEHGGNVALYAEVDQDGDTAGHHEPRQPHIDLMVELEVLYQFVPLLGAHSDHGYIIGMSGFNGF